MGTPARQRRVSRPDNSLASKSDEMGGGDALIVAGDSQRSRRRERPAPSTNQRRAHTRKGRRRSESASLSTSSHTSWVWSTARHARDARRVFSVGWSRALRWFVCLFGWDVYGTPLTHAVLHPAKSPHNAPLSAPPPLTVSGVLWRARPVCPPTSCLYQSERQSKNHINKSMKAISPDGVVRRARWCPSRRCRPCGSRP